MIAELVRFAAFLIAIIAISIILYRKGPAIGFTALCVATAFLGFIVIRHRIDAAFTPHWRANGLNDHLESQTAYHAKKATIDGRDYIMLVPIWNPLQHMANVCIFRSGTPAYVFDGDGSLVAWASDMDENAAFQQRWLDASQWQPIDMQSLGMMIRQRDERQNKGVVLTGDPLRGSPAAHP